MHRSFYHQPVLQKTAIEYLLSDRDGTYVDCTLGGGGHPMAILEHLAGEGFLVALDADPDAIRYAEERLKDFPNKAIRQTFYDQLDVVLLQLGKLPVSGVLFDLGISSYQIDKDARGFSFQADGPLDMRFNPGQRLSAETVVNEYSEEALGKIFREHGEEHQWRRIARALVDRRQSERLQTTGELAGVVRSVVGGKFQSKSLARVFQAIRIEVNDELNRLNRALEMAFESLGEGGRMVVISYHSLEDRIVKEFFRYKALDCICPPELPKCICDKQKEVSILTRKPVVPAADEIMRNPRARSARLRAAEKTVPYVEGN